MLRLCLIAAISCSGAPVWAADEIALSIVTPKATVLVAEPVAIGVTVTTDVPVHVYAPPGYMAAADYLLPNVQIFIDRGKGFERYTPPPTYIGTIGGVIGGPRKEPLRGGTKTFALRIRLVLAPPCRRPGRAVGAAASCVRRSVPVKRVFASASREGPRGSSRKDGRESRACGRSVGVAVNCSRVVRDPHRLYSGRAVVVGRLLHRERRLSPRLEHIVPNRRTVRWHGGRLPGANQAGRDSRRVQPTYG